ncbi:MAG: 16S rRNA (cytidine(1402)-2'-O)-methyltransferase [Coriobacteriales bacterium]|jgi:16S rRNA (cytidine1402-2'-O)-methyltransferase
MTTSTTSGNAANGSSGELLICATPIGNLGDVTSRLLDAFDSCDVIYAEDTRVARRLLSHFGMSSPVVRCDENVISEKVPEVCERVLSGQRVVFVSDAGMPCISDPGQKLVAAFRERGLPMTVLPGASAAVTAVAGCGFPGKAYYFGGFLPRKAGERVRVLEGLADLDAMLVFYESNHRTADTLRAIAKVFPKRRVCMARELTKVHEEYAVMLAAELADMVDSREGGLKGEVVLVIEPPVEVEGEIDPESLQEAITEKARELSLQEGMTSPKIAKQLVAIFGISRDEAYEVARSCNRNARRGS